MPSRVPLATEFPPTERMFVFRYIRFLFDSTQQDYLPVTALSPLSVRSIRSRLQKGYDAEVPNLIDFDGFEFSWMCVVSDSHTVRHGHFM